MKVKNKNGIINVTLTESEAYRLYNFIEYATRDGMDWITTIPLLGVRSLNRSDSNADGAWGSMMGHVECSKLAEAIFSVNDYMEIDL